MTGSPAGGTDAGTNQGSGGELAPVPDAERWRRIADLAGAHEAEADIAAGEPDDGDWD